MRDTIDEHCAAKANIAPWHIDWPTLPCAPRGLAAAIRALYQGPAFAALRQGKNSLREQFLTQHLRYLAIARRAARSRRRRLSPPSPAGAQSIGQVGPSSRHHRRAAADHRRADASKTDDFETKIEASRDDDTTLVEIRLQLEELARQLLKSGLAFRPRLAEINARIEQLGPPPAEGQPAEPDIVSSERQALVAEKAEINAVLGAAESLSLRVNGLIDQIAELRRELFAQLPDQALRHQLRAGRRGGRRLLFRRRRVQAHGRCLGALRRPVQAALRPGRHVLRAAGGGGPADRRAAAVRPADRRRIRRSKSRPISAGCRWRSGRHCCRPPRSRVFLATTYFLYDYFSVLRPRHRHDDDDAVHRASASCSSCTGWPRRCCRRSCRTGA